MSVPLDESRDLPLEPLLDTWQVQSASWWAIRPAVPKYRSASELNSWYAQAAADSLDSLGRWVRPWRIVALIPESKAQSEYRLSYTWEAGSSAEHFLNHALKNVRETSGAIYDLTMELDLKVWFRTLASPEKPVRAWLRMPTDLQIAGPHRDREAFLNLSIGHSVFAASTWQRGSNEELHTLNQPLLGEALRRWEQHLGPIIEVEGVGVFRYGFRGPGGKEIAGG